LYSTIAQEVFEAKQAVGGISQAESLDVGWGVGNPVFKVLGIYVEMGTRQALAGAVERIGRVPVGRPIEVQARQDDDFSRTRLVLEPRSISPASLKVEQKFFAAVH
jgi:hypothetical protein